MDFIFSLPVIDELIVVEVEARGTGVDVAGVVVLDAGGTTCLNRKQEIVVNVAGVVADVVAAVVPVVGAVVATDVGAVVGEYGHVSWHWYRQAEALRGALRPQQGALFHGLPALPTRPLVQRGITHEGDLSGRKGWFFIFK